MKLNCPTSNCGEGSCPIAANLPVQEQAATVALVNQVFGVFDNSEVAMMSREDRELLLIAAERRKPDETPIAERIISPSAYAIAATAIHRHINKKCQPVK